MKKKGLGKGLGALISSPEDIDRAAPSAETPPAGTGAPATADGAQLLALDPRDIRPNPQQPRRAFDEESLLELADSIRRDGVQEPVIVRARDGHYELVSGERRVRASVLAELNAIPAVCREVSDSDMLRLGLIENIQRENLNAIELAEAYQELTDTFSWTQEELAAQVGKKRVTITNTLRLLNLPKDVQQQVIQGNISGGHARAILAIESPAAQSRACRQVIAKGLSVRQTEKLAARSKNAVPAAKAQPLKDPNVTAIEDDLRRKLGTQVRLKTNAKHRGKIEIDFFNLEDLERILRMLGS